MESRKKRNLEIERRKKEKQRITTSILMGLIALVVIALGYSVWDIQNRRTIMTFEGERIATSDFRYFHSMTGMPPGEETQQVIMDNLVQTLVVLERAERHGLSLSEENRANLEEHVRNFRGQNPGAFNFISDRRIMELDSIWLLFEPLMDIYVPDYELDEEEFAPLLETHLEGIHDSLIQFKYLESDDWFELEDAIAALEAGGDFDTIAREIYGLPEEEEIATVDLSTLLDFYDISERRPELLSLEEGEVSEIIIADDVFFIIQMYNNVVDDEVLESAEELFRERNIQTGRAGIFWALIEEWIEQADYTVNERALRRF